jgi:hypothetical protein
VAAPVVEAAAGVGVLLAVAGLVFAVAAALRRPTGAMAGVIGVGLVVTALMSRH